MEGGGTRKSSEPAQEAPVSVPGDGGTHTRLDATGLDRGAREGAFEVAGSIGGRSGGKEKAPAGAGAFHVERTRGSYPAVGIGCAIFFHIAS